MIHAQALIDETICVTPLEPGDQMVVIESAVDPAILKIDCPKCAAIINYSLREGGW